MTPGIYAAGAVLTLLGLALIVVPLLRHRDQPGVGISLIVMTLGFPLAVAAVYMSASTFPWDEPQQARAVNQPAADQPPVGEMIMDLAARLEEQPDVEGYILLARSYTSLQRFADAVDAWHKAWELTEGKDPDVSLGYAEALILADRRTLKTSAADLVEAAIAERPNDPRALWYGGLSAAELGRTDLAVERLSLLLQADLPDEFRLVVQQQLANLGAASPAMQADNQAQGAEEGGTVTVAARVDLDPALAELLPPNATLFVFAQDAGRPGPPIAAKRLPLADFPVEVTLTDSDVMIQGNSLSRPAQLKIAARISASGNPIARPGDLYGEIDPDMSSGPDVEATVLINSVEQ